MVVVVVAVVVFVVAAVVASAVVAVAFFFAAANPIIGHENSRIVHLVRDTNGIVDGWHDSATSHRVPTRSSSAYVQYTLGLSLELTTSH